MIPVHKSETRSNINNYWPISLLLVVSKILDKLVYNRIYSFLTKHNFFFESQFGFRKKHSTGHAAYLLVDKITDAFENKKKALCVFLDLSKAFDTINFNVLSKLNHYGVKGVAHQWFDSYLKNRSQVVCCSDTLSLGKQEILHGVPQGSILSTLSCSMLMTSKPA